MHHQGLCTEDIEVTLVITTEVCNEHTDTDLLSPLYAEHPNSAGYKRRDSVKRQEFLESFFS